VRLTWDAEHIESARSNGYALNDDFEILGCLLTVVQMAEMKEEKRKQGRWW
jgi:hypothetical protein